MKINDKVRYHTTPRQGRLPHPLRQHFDSFKALDTALRKWAEDNGTALEYHNKGMEVYRVTPPIGIVDLLFVIRERGRRGTRYKVMLEVPPPYGKG